MTMTTICILKNPKKQITNLENTTCLQHQISRVSPTIEDEPLEDWANKFVEDRLK